MFHQSVLVYIVTVCIEVVNLYHLQSNLTSNGFGYQLIFSKVDSHLIKASKIIGAAREELSSDLKQLCEIQSANNSARCFRSHRRKKNHPDGKPVDCGDIYNEGYNVSGVYHIWPHSRIYQGPILASCDMEDGGGWTVVQRRGDYGDPDSSFYNDWDDYKNGFGTLSEEFWIGNDLLFALTSQRSYRLKVDLETWEDDSLHYASYSSFWIDDEIHNYTLHLGTYEGTAGDSLQRQNGSSFSTKDRDNDNNEEGNCATTFQGGWWYNHCTDSNLNGPYVKGCNVTHGAGIIWSTLQGYGYSLKDTVMKIRAEEFRKGVRFRTY